MSNRRARVSRITEDEINDLILKLQALLPDSSSRSHNSMVSASKIVKETCNYLKKLHKEVDDLSERLSQLLASGAITSTNADAISSLLRQ
ncbi:transcription factor ILI5-like [Sesamum indicum]|uniref:Transcription factor ILI5-like n=1 Tax=Sesamum indicum TaxID=4182 RepID=A0A6I9U0C5_SESIN|nr:transcription factor ILI5-like [Sesamum indicum]